jgi:predicted nucleotidyltransferase component of viral defense system
VDLFTPELAEVARLADALTATLQAEGAEVWVDRRGPGFTRLAVKAADGQSVVVEIAHDALIREAVQMSFGRVLNPDEVAADKTLALFGRAAARDLVDVAALLPRQQTKRPSPRNDDTEPINIKAPRRFTSFHPE